MITLRDKKGSAGSSRFWRRALFTIAVVILLIFLSLEESHQQLLLNNYSRSVGLFLVAPSYHSVDCSSFLKREQQAKPDEQPVLVKTEKTTKQFYVSLHPQTQDEVRWDIVTYGRYYEWSLEDAFTEILTRQKPKKDDNDSIIIILDVGGNIGYYSLFAASLGNFTIHSFEPHPKNVLRFCEAVGANHWWPSPVSASSSSESSVLDRSQIYIWETGVSNETDKDLKFIFNPVNPGAGHFHVPGEKIRKHATVVSIPIITLDSFAQNQGWFLPTKFDNENSSIANNRIEILKIDVERHEAQVLLGASRLLQSGWVQNIFIEIGKGERSIQRKALRLLINNGYIIYKYGDFRGPEHDASAKWPNLVLSKTPPPIGDAILEYLYDENLEADYINTWWIRKDQSIQKIHEDT